jgi:hypothetical protein
MKTKICRICKIEKLLINFSPDKTHKDGLHSECKKCACKLVCVYEKEQFKMYPWKRVFSHIKQRCNNPKSQDYKYYGGRGIKNKFKNADEIKFLWFRDKAYEMKKPSIDRKDNDGNYELSNCRFIEFNDNRIKDKIKIVLQFDKHWNLIQEWRSFGEIKRILGFAQSNLCYCCSGKIKTAYGFIWKHK